MRTFRVIRAAVALAVLAVLVYGGFRSVGPLPRLGPLLHPTTGFWAVATEEPFPAEWRTRVPGLRDSVRILVDDRAVPHIFAGSVADAFRALGYLHARHRLFQLELQVRATDGTLTELLGERALPVDRRNRHLGIPRSVERELTALDTAGVEGRVLRAYAQGINARIAELTRADLPLEYRLLDAWPRRWDVPHSLFFGRRMAYTLSYSRHDRAYGRLVELVGEEAARGLAPVHNPLQEPIVPSTRPTPRFLDLEIARPRFGGDGTPVAALPPAPGGLEEGLPWAGWNGGAASNNWVVGPTRSRSGRALLAGDPQLDLTLPSIWYEAHLVVPDSLDVYGVTFPGAPLVPVGFNRRVAWSFTNTGNDIVDFYAEELDDDEAPSAYLLDGAWRRLERRIEVYRDPAGTVLATDTVWYTHRGPLVRDEGAALSLRWATLEAPFAFTALWNIMFAGDVDGWLRAMARYTAPVQNGVVADWLGNIAVASYGLYPVRPDGAPRVGIQNGRTRASDWAGMLPPSRQPNARNPAQGYLASANQQPVDPAVDGTYLGANWPAPWRAMRINALLRADTAVTPEAMRRFQTDPGSARADLFLPHFLRAVDEWSAAGGGDLPELARAREAAELLREWDRQYTTDNERAVLFEAAMDELERRAWDELIVGQGDRRGFRFRPGEVVLAVLLRDSSSVWWDDRGTDRVESRAEILIRSLAAALDTVVRRHGPAADGGWRWDRINHANIWHLLGFPAWSVLGIPVQGGPGTLNPIEGSGTHGPSWRMVVELGPEVRAWSIYPGGQSGNPVSRWYADRIPAWAAGVLEPVVFAPDAAAVRTAGTIARFVLVPGGP